MPSCKVFMSSGGDELAVSSGGYAIIEDGGQVDVESGGHIDVESGGYVSVESGGQIRDPLQAVTSTGTSLKNYGVSTVPAVTAAGYKTYTMSRPSAAGLRKTIQYAIASSSKRPVNIDLSSGVTVIGETSETAARYIGGSNSTTKTDFVELVSMSTAKWLCVSKTTTVVLTTKATTA